MKTIKPIEKIKKCEYCEAEGKWHLCVDCGNEFYCKNSCYGRFCKECDGYKKDLINREDI